MRTFIKNIVVSYLVIVSIVLMSFYTCSGDNTKSIDIKTFDNRDKAIIWLIGQVLIQKNVNCRIELRNDQGVCSMIDRGFVAMDDGLNIDGDFALTLLKDNGSRSETNYFDNYKSKSIYTTSYILTKKQLKEYNKKIHSTLKKLNLKNKSNKIKAIKICDFVERITKYDYKYKKKNHDISFTAYGALIKYKAVCEGYAALVYDLCRRSGVPCRIITGWSWDIDDPSNKNSHAWNIIKINGKWYDCDTTWTDTGSNNYDFIGDKKLSKDHIRDNCYMTKDFNKNFPISKTSLK